MGIGNNMTRVDAKNKITGSARYMADLKPKGLLVAKVVHNTIADGMVKSFDLKETLAVPGVVKIVACFDVSGIRLPAPGHPWSVETTHQDVVDRKFLNTRVRVYGDGIAAVIAEDEIATTRAARKIKAEYEKYEPLLTVGAVMTEGATHFHGEKPGDVIAHSVFKVGEGVYEEAIKEEGLVVIDKNYRTQSVQRYHIEAPVSFAYTENNRITVTTPTQIPHIVRRVISQALGLPMDRIRVIKPYIGGGFGNRQDVLYEPLNAFLTTQVGSKGIRLELSKEEILGCTRVHHAIEFKVKTATREDETLVTRKLEACSNQGGYASRARAIAANSSNKSKQIYRDEKVLESSAYTIYTSITTGGAMRGYGIPQATFVAECMADDLALTLHMDPLEFRKKNCMQAGYEDPHTHVKCNSCGLEACMEKGRGFIRWDEKRKEYENQIGPVRKGIGMAVFCYKTGVYPISLEAATCHMILNQGSSMQLQMGVTEIGQGAGTMSTQVVTEVTGITGDKVSIMSAQDTDITPFGTGAYASRQTYVSGMAVKKTDAVLKEKILDYGAYMLGRSQDTLDIEASCVVDQETRQQLLSMEELATMASYSLDRSVHITAEATSHCKANTFAAGVCFAEMEVDMPLGKVEVTNIVNVHNDGTLTNSKLVTTQIHGGMSMGLGYGLSKQLLFDVKERPLSDSLLDYKLPTPIDTPNLNTLFVELDDPTGPFDNKALGEPPAIPVAPAVRNAVLHATGVAMDSLPLSPQKIVEYSKAAGLI